jgi:hypothetical protein
MSEKRRVLAIDGGGIKGIYPLAFLASVEEKTELKAASFFDLIVGTSTGGIIALGLGLGWSAQELLEMYRSLGKRVFASGMWERIKSAWRHWMLAKYDSEPLRDLLDDSFGEKRLGRSEKRLVIPSANLEEGSVYLYKTAHSPRFREDYQERVVDIALSTAAAPTYFPAHHSSYNIPLIDGGVWANNPSAVGAVEALEILDWERGSVDLLSLSCTSEPFDIGWGQRFGLGRLYWSTKVTDLFMATQASAAHGMTQHLLGKDHVVRIDHVVPKGEYGLDTVNKVDQLVALGRTKARHRFPELKEQFFESTASTFEPHYTL